MEALAALPPTTAVDPKEIDDLKKQNKHNLADSLANVKRLLDSTNFIEFMLTALQPLQQVSWLQLTPKNIHKRQFFLVTLKSFSRSIFHVLTKNVIL